MVLHRVGEVEALDPPGETLLVLETGVGWPAKADNPMRSHLDAREQHGTQAHLLGLQHSTWVTLMSQDLGKVVPEKVKARVAVFPVTEPMST